MKISAVAIIPDFARLRLRGPIEAARCSQITSLSERELIYLEGDCRQVRAPYPALEVKPDKVGA